MTSPEDTSIGAVPGAGVGGERRQRAKPGDVSDPGEDLAGGQIPTAELGQGAGRGCHGGADLGSGRGDPPIEMADLADELDGQPAQGAWTGAARADAAQQLRGVVGAQVAWRSSGEELGEQDMEPVDGLSAGLHHVVAVLDQGV